VGREEVETGSLVCWWCGYGLDGVDLMRTDLRCPECGKENVPGNGRDAPHVRRHWPGWWVLAGVVCWPGALLGLSIGAQELGGRAEWIGGLKAGFAMAGLPAACFCVFWPPLVAELIVDERVAGMFRRRWLMGVGLGGIVVNGVVAAGLGSGARVVASLL
jgi:hypothetical protein